MRVRDLYAEWLANWLSAGDLINKDKMSALAIRPVFDRILTRGYVTKVWAISSIPVRFEYNLTDLVRQEMFRRCPYAKVDIVFSSKATKPNVTSDTFTRQLAQATELKTKYEDFYANLQENEKIAGKTIHLGGGRRFTFNKRDLDRIIERAESYLYVYSHAMSGGSFFKVNLFVQVSVENSKQMKDVRRELSAVLTHKGIRFSEITGQMSKYLSNYGPASLKQEEISKFPTLLLSDENIANLTSYMTQGLVGGEGILLGTNLLSKLPVIVNFFESTSAQVILICAKAGEGKTALSQMMTLQFLADVDEGQEEGKHCTWVDLKGGEWDVLDEYSDLLKISMGDKDPKFVNTMRLDDLEVTILEAESIFMTAVKDTIQLFSLMVNLTETEGNPADLEVVLETAILKVYDKHGVVSTNPATFKKTKDIRLKEVLPYVESQKLSKALSEGAKKLCPIIIDRCETYFSSEGRQSAAFRNEVSLAEIINQQFVVFSLDKNQNTVVDDIDRIKVHMIAVLNAKKSYMRKKKGLHTVEGYEEGARAGDTGQGAGSLLNIISHRATGSRSNNVTILLLTNTLSMFENPQAKPIKSNITTVIAGKLDQGDIDILEHSFRCEQIIPYVKSISFDGDTKLKNAFALKLDTGKTVDKALFKVNIPDSIERKVRTRDVVSSRKKAPTA